LVDTENALDETWLHALGVDTGADKLLKLNMSMIDDVAKAISTFMIDYKALPDGERMKVLWVIDSLGMLLTPTDVNQFEAGDMKGDMGRKPKALTSLVRNSVNMFGGYNVGMVCTNHTYASQDMFDPDDKISGGQGFIYASSIVVAMKKMKLKEEFLGLPGPQIRDLKFQGVEITREIRTPLVAYTGDTNPEGLDKNPDFFKAKILIAEMSFVRPNHKRSKVHKFGHMHLDDFVERADRFENELIICGHASTRYHPDEIRRVVDAKLPSPLRERLRLWL
jgi:hypothetical protein